MRASRSLRSFVRGRQDKRQPPIKSGFSVKEWIGITISCAAFGLSSFTTYLSTFRTQDDVHLFDTVDPFIWHNAASPQVNARMISDWVFTNAGNRAAAVTTAAFMLVRDYGASNDDCQKYVMGEIRLSIEPFVIQPRQVEIKQVKFKLTDDATGATTVSDRANIFIGTNYPENEEIKIKACFVVYLNTPDESIRAARIGFRTTWRTFNETRFAPSSRLVFDDRAKPWSLVKRTMNKFM